MNTSAAGVVQWRATIGDWPTTATTTSSMPASCTVARNVGRVSILPMRASTTVGSCHSQPAWFSSEPRWWSTAKTTVPADRAAAPSQIVERPQYEPTSTNGAPGTAEAAASAAAWRASPSSGGMKPLAAIARGRQSSLTGRSVRPRRPPRPNRRSPLRGPGQNVPVQAALDDLVTLLALEPIEVNIFRGRSPDENRQRVFGGQVAGQALVAAARTVDDSARLVHSLHAYFLRPGDPTVPILYEVDRLRDGRSFTTRRVVAIQHGRAIFNLQASFHGPEPGPDHQMTMPTDVPDPESLPDWHTQMAPYKEQMGDWYDRPRPIDVRYVDGDPFSRKGIPTDGQRVWLRAAGQLPDDPVVHACIVTYASDMSLLDTTVLPFGLAWDSPGMQMASLDHAMWFHRPFRADEWLLYDQHALSTGSARGLAGGAIFSMDGRLVVSVVQEGLARVGR
jgi:acyl-CoA thioesterase-2